MSTGIGKTDLLEADRWSIWQRLWASFVILLMAVIMILPTFAPQDWLLRQSIWVQLICKATIATIWAFIGSSHVYVWWRPPFVRRMFARQYTRISLIVGLLLAIFFILLVVLRILEWLK